MDYFKGRGSTERNDRFKRVRGVEMHQVALKGSLIIATNSKTTEDCMTDCMIEFLMKRPAELLAHPRHDQGCDRRKKLDVSKKQCVGRRQVRRSQLGTGNHKWLRNSSTRGLFRPQHWGFHYHVLGEDACS